MLHDVVVIGHMCPRSMLLALLTMKKELREFMYLVLLLRLVALWAAGALLKTGLQYVNV